MTDIDSRTIGQAQQLAAALALLLGTPPALASAPDVHTRELIGQLAALIGGGCAKPCPFKIGEKYLIRTVTVYVVGRVREVVGDFLIMDDASWVADTGKFSTALSSGSLNEVERVPDGTIVGLGSITDAQPWLHCLPKETK